MLRSDICYCLCGSQTTRVCGVLDSDVSSGEKKLCVRISSASNVYLHKEPCLAPKPNTRTNLHQNHQKAYSIKTDTHPFSRAKMVNVQSGREFWQRFPLWSTSLLRRGESHKLPFGASCKTPAISLRLLCSQPCLSPSSSLSTLFQPLSQPQAQGCTACLPPAGSRPGEAWNNRRPWGCLQGSS